jgi:putative ABC transport system permease protein
MKQIYYAIQNIIRGKDSTLIKVISLSLGLFLSIILFALIGVQLSFDTFYQDNEDIYVVQTEWDFGDRKIQASPYNIFPTGKTLMKHFPEQVKSVTVIFPWASSAYQHGTKKFSFRTIKSDSLFFQTMGIPLLHGNAKDLAMTDAIFLSESAARKIFGQENPMGKSLNWANQMDVIVKGIFADIPENTTTHPEAVLCIYDGLMRQDWTSGGNFMTMLRLKKKADAHFINERAKAVLANYLPIDDYYGEMGIKRIDISVTPLKGYFLQNKKTSSMIFIVSLLGLMLLLTAAFNYALISISSLSHRAKAIGVHKCSGAENSSIFGIFLWETLLITSLSTLVAIFLILNFQQQIEDMVSVKIETLFAPSNLWMPALTIFILFIIGCILPGKLFSSIPVTQVFRRYTEGKKRWKYPLLFVQFISATFFIGFICIIFLQYQYAMNKDLGWSSERLAYTNVQFPNLDNGLSTLRNLPYVEAVEFARSPMWFAYQPEPIKDSNGNIMFYPRFNQGNADFCRLVKLKLIEGNFHTRQGEVIVNQPFVKAMGWTSNGIGEVIPGIGTVTGIIDFYFPDYKKMEPFLMEWKVSGTGYTHIRLKEPFDENLIRLNEDMKQIYAQEEIEFWSVSLELEEEFETERTFRDSVLIACIAILAITLMGVIGYTNDEVQRRSKEIAIRKVNGAEAGDILKMLCQDIAIIALPAVLIGTLASAYIGEIWVLSNFKDILSINPLIYISIAIIAIAFILGTVIVKSWRVANENPVISIKSE